VTVICGFLGAGKTTLLRHLLGQASFAKASEAGGGRARWAAIVNDMAAVNVLIRDRMASRHAPRIPEVTAHLVEAGGKRLRPMLTLAAATICGYQGDNHIKLAATVEFIHTATLLHDDVVDESSQRRGRRDGYGVSRP
jgi:geranylgeranyl pyrophosphate synthase